MIEDLLVITEAGQAIYGWHQKGNNKDFNDDLVSGFLTALNSFATIERGEDIKSLRLKETLILFEKYEELFNKLTFVITTKNEEIVELLHAVVHEVMDQFIFLFKGTLNKEFSGNITPFRKFDQNITQILNYYGLDTLEQLNKEFNKGDFLKALLFIDSKGGNIFYIKANEYVNKEKMSFLVPLLVNSSKLLYKDKLNQEINWLTLSTVENEILLIDIRYRIILARIYKSQFILRTQEILDLPYFNEKTGNVYIKKPQKIIDKFKNIKPPPNIQQLFLVDLLGKIFYKKIIDDSFNYNNLIPETISFITSSKKSSEEIFKRIMLISIICGQKTTTICMNFRNFALILLGNTTNLNNFQELQKLCMAIYEQL
ncbi:MAG: hypothetical protein JXA99_08200 [Candidatus Lokiarchaeota archaeon]|nr:hypothetical protein [Candidatus Lokiarchaeota archaeon]